MVLAANVLATVSPNFSQFGPGAADLELKMYLQLANCSLLRNREKIKFSGIQVGRDYHSEGDTAEGPAFYITIAL